MKISMSKMEGAIVLMGGYRQTMSVDMGAMRNDIASVPLMQESVDRMSQSVGRMQYDTGLMRQGVGAMSNDMGSMSHPFRVINNLTHW